VAQQQRDAKRAQKDQLQQGGAERDTTIAGMRDSLATARRERDEARAEKERAERERDAAKAEQQAAATAGGTGREEEKKQLQRQHEDAMGEATMSVTP
jgi:hypothetical protein